MLDMRSNKLALKGFVKLSGLAVNEENVIEMLTALGVNPDEQTVKEAIGFLSSNSMEFNMENLSQFLKNKSIISKIDMRKKKD